MNKFQMLYLIPFMMLSSHGHSMSVESLDVDTRVKLQINDAFQLDRAIKQFTDRSGGGAPLPVVTVGRDDDSACDYRGANKIQNAINDHTSVEIRVAEFFVNENLVINDKSVWLRGRYANCSDAANNIPQPPPFAENNPFISGVEGVNRPVISIEGSSRRSTIVLDKISISRGKGVTEEFPGGGISINGANAQIKLDKVNISGGEGLKGGAIAIVGGNTNIIATDTLIISSKALAGGGVYCSGSNASFTIVSGGIRANDANGTNTNDGGGGVFLDSRCSFLMFAEKTGIDFGINRNNSVFQGGGMVVSGGSLATLFGHEVCTPSGDNCFGSNTVPVTIEGNISDTGNGGGLLIRGFNTEVNIFGGHISRNHARYGNGGGVSITASAALTVKRLSKSCWSNECNQLERNSANAAAAHGGAIRCHSANVSVENTVIHGNNADLGNAIAATNCTASIKGSLLYNNGSFGSGDGNFAIFVTLGELDIQHSTIARNNANRAVLYSRINDTKIVASIISDFMSRQLLSDESTTTDLTIECSMVHEVASLGSANLPFTVLDDPEFTDFGSFRLDPLLSPAVDYCYATASSNDRDLLFQQRGWDDPAIDNLHGPFDIGAYEINPELFSSGFE